MAAVASGIMAMIGAVAVLAVIVGAVTGSLFWKAKRGLALGGLSVVGVYLLAVLAFLKISWLGAVLFGATPLILTFLVSYLAARLLKVRANLRPIWATLAALSAALIVGFFYLLLLKFNLWASVWIAVGLDAFLMLLAIRNWKLAPQ
jgi:hypothetical protein